jgi:two-component system, NarL family, response regulator NreC
LTIAEKKQMGVQILIADDHEIVLEGIRTLVRRASRQWEICGEARDGQDAVEKVKTLKPDITILDITMPGISGLEAARRITRLGTGCRVLIFTMHESERLSFEVRESGAHGLVLKSQAARDLIRAIDSLLAGGTFFGGLPEPTKRANEKPNPGPLFCQAFALKWS